MVLTAVNKNFTKEYAMGPIRRILRPTTPVNQVARDSMAPTPQAPTTVMQKKDNRPETVFSGNIRDTMADKRPRGLMARRGFGHVAVQRPAPAAPVQQESAPAPSPAPVPPPIKIPSRDDLQGRVGVFNSKNPNGPQSTNRNVKADEQRAKDAKVTNSLNTGAFSKNLGKGAPKFDTSILGAKPQPTNSVNSQGSPFPIPDSLAQQQAQSKLGQQYGGLGYDYIAGPKAPPQMGGGSPMNPNYVNPSPTAQKPPAFDEQDFYQNNG
jgi:hypothetical protein